MLIQYLIDLCWLLGKWVVLSGVYGWDRFVSSMCGVNSGIFRVCQLLAAHNRARYFAWEKTEDLMRKDHSMNDNRYYK